MIITAAHGDTATSSMVTKAAIESTVSNTMVPTYSNTKPSAETSIVAKARDCRQKIELADRPAAYTHSEPCGNEPTKPNTITTTANQAGTESVSDCTHGWVLSWK